MTKAIKVKFEIYYIIPDNNKKLVGITRSMIVDEVRDAVKYNEISQNIGIVEVDVDDSEIRYDFAELFCEKEEADE